MKKPLQIRLIGLSLALGSMSQGQTIEWGSPDGIDIVDSAGAVLDNTFVFELGAFANSFVPNQNNTSHWFANWRAFDRANYNEVEGVFTSTVNMLDDGTSNSPFMTAGATSFSGLDAYFWVRNNDDPGPGSEWFLARATNWLFPAAIPGCCDEGPPIKWSLSDLTASNVPNWGSQSGVREWGEYTVTSAAFELQTHTFVPEPSGTLLLMAGGCVLLVRRRRPA